MREEQTAPRPPHFKLPRTLSQGGVTPSIGDIQGAVLAVKGSKTKLHVLIRPRPGDFVYSSLEKQVTSSFAHEARNVYEIELPREKRNTYSRMLCGYRDPVKAAQYTVR